MSASEGDIVGVLQVPVEANFEKFDRQVGPELKQRAEAAAEAAAAALRQRFTSELEKLDQEFTRKQSDAQSRLAEGLMGKGDFERAGQRAAAEFAESLERALREIQRGSKLAPAAIAAVDQLREEFRKHGFEAGQHLTDGIAEGIDEAAKQGERSNPANVLDVEQIKDEARRQGVEAGKQLVEGVEAGVKAEEVAVTVPVTLDTAGLEREGRANLTEKAERVAVDTGAALRRRLLPELDRLDKEWTEKQIAAQKKFAEGLIKKGDFEKAGKQAAEEYADGLDRAMRDMMNRGKLSPAEFIEFERMKAEVRQQSFQVGEQLGEGISEGTKKGLFDLETFLRRGFMVGVVGAIVLLVRRITSAVADAVQEASRMVRLEGGFQQQSFRRDINPEDALRELRDATRGTVTDMELMARANKLLQSELPITAQSLGEVARVARRLGESLGLDATESYERFIDALTAGRPEFLKQLGILTTKEEAVRRWGMATGETTRRLTEQEKTVIFFNAVMEEARGKVRSMGEEQMDAGTRLEQARTSWENLKQAIVIAIGQSDPIADFFDRIGLGATEAGDRVQQLANKVTAFLNTYRDELRGALAGAGAGAFALGPVGILPGAALGTLGASAAGQGRHGTYSENLQALQQRDAQETRRREIQAVTEIARLEAMRSENQRAILGMQNLGIVNHVREQELLQEIEQIEARITELRRPRPRDTPPGLTAEERQRLLEQAEQVQTRMRQMLTQLTATALDEQLAALAEFERAATATYSKLGQALPRELREGLARLRADAQQNAALELRARELDGMSDQFATSERGATQEDLATLYAWIEALESERDALEEGSRIRERYTALIARAKSAYDQAAQSVVRSAQAEIKAHEDAEKAAEQRAREEERRARERQREIRDQARAIEENVRATLQLAEAFGIVDQKTSQMLQNLSQLGVSIFRIASGDLAAIPSAIAATAGIVSSLAGSGRDQEINRRHAEILQSHYRLVQALDELRGAVLRDMTPNQRAALQAAGESFVRRFDILFDPQYSGAVGTARFGKNSPFGQLSQADHDFFMKLQQATGIDFFDADKMEVNLQRLQEAWRAFLEMDVGAFGYDVQGRLDAIDYMFRLAGESIGDATTKMEMFIEALRNLPEAAAFADEFENILRTQGEDAARAWLEQQAILFGTGGSGALGAWAEGLTPAEIQRIIEAALARLDDVGGEGTTQKLGRLPLDHGSHREPPVRGPDDVQPLALGDPRQHRGDRGCHGRAGLDACPHASLP